MRIAKLALAGLVALAAGAIALPSLAQEHGAPAAGGEAEAAQVNVAAISYYFGDKAGLYRAVFFDLQSKPEEEIRRYGNEAMSLGDALRGFYLGFLEPLKQGELTTLCMKLHMREMLEPTGLWAEEIDQGIRPMHEALVKVLCRHVGVAQPDDEIQRLAVCVSALGVHLHVGRDVTDAIAPTLNSTPAALDRWLDEHMQSEKVACRLTTISAVIREHGLERIDLLKLDAERSELDALAGIHAEDWPKIHQMVIEVHDAGIRDRVLEVLAAQGFATVVEQDVYLEGTELYNVYARRPGGLLSVSEKRGESRIDAEGAGGRRRRPERGEAWAEPDLLALHPAARLRRAHRLVDAEGGGQASLPRAALLLDEPLNAVDAGTRETISRVLSGLKDRGKTMVVATHDHASLASEFDGALYLREGREVRPEPGADDADEVQHVRRQQEQAAQPAGAHEAQQAEHEQQRRVEAEAPAPQRRQQVRVRGEQQRRERVEPDVVVRS